ncbi:hypothetical protein NADE_001858 [Nannochloris sp. 'desiccata']|nr:hypothetical protein KSW81_001295 [Chlorella desiccata (nom. nud.)]KAH7617058.1 hypothetical protein NADE_001858 [Chlorella desiccata (nom. nud.)]
MIGCPATNAQTISKNWGMMRSNTGGAGGLTARNIKLPEDGSLDGEFDIGGGLSTLADEVLKLKLKLLH